MMILSHEYVYEREKKERKERTSNNENSFSTFVSYKRIHERQCTIIFLHTAFLVIFCCFFRRVQYNSIDN